MTARVETQWVGVSGLTDMIVTYPAGGTPADVEISTIEDTHADLAQAMEDALNAAQAPSPFTVAVHGSHGAFEIESSDLNFDLTCNAAIRTFLGLPHISTDWQMVEGDRYPPSQYRSLAPLPEPEPFMPLDRPVSVTDWGRVHARLREMSYVQPIGLQFGLDSAGQDWFALFSWLRYAMMGNAFSLFRDTDSTLYQFIDPNLDGRSLCKLTSNSRQVARRFSSEPAMVRGWLRLHARITEGY